MHFGYKENINTFGYKENINTFGGIKKIILHIWYKANNITYLVYRKGKQIILHIWYKANNIVYLV